KAIEADRAMPRPNSSANPMLPWACIIPATSSTMVAVLWPGGSRRKRSRRCRSARRATVNKWINIRVLFPSRMSPRISLPYRAGKGLVLGAGLAGVGGSIGHATRLSVARGGADDRLSYPALHRVYRPERTRDG